MSNSDSGFSTLRRSLGAVLKDRLGLQAVPRSAGPSPKNCDCYSFIGDGEFKLTAWMRDNLLIAIEPLPDAVVTTEAQLIALLQPPLCLKGWPNPQRSAIKAMRKGCKQEARRAAEACS